MIDEIEFVRTVEGLTKRAREWRDRHGGQALLFTQMVDPERWSSHDVQLGNVRLREVFGDGGVHLVRGKISTQQSGCFTLKSLSAVTMELPMSGGGSLFLEGMG